MKLLSFFCFLLLAVNVKAKIHHYRGVPNPAPALATRLHGTITIDGILSEPAWRRAKRINDFTQATPDEGAKPTERTVVRILYDNNAIYIGARMYDNHPDSIIALLGRRDAPLKADKFIVYFDPFNDGQTGYYFGVNAGGTLYDGTMYNDVRKDNSWDGVWIGKAHRDKKGWTVEMRIPFSQLRFHEEKNYVWGIDFKRDIGRNNEQDYLVYTPKNGNGFVSLFPELLGIKKIKPKQDIEFVPYITSKISYLQHDAGNPFIKGPTYNTNIGGDIKASIGSDLTMDATIDPDFGQVEVDPAVVNLSDVETFYPEKRPFFIEGNNFFNFGHGGATSYWNLNWPHPYLFYSRRIGEKPQGSVPTYDYVDYPDATHIIGAAKLTGQTENNWNIGGLEAITSTEIAHYSVNNKIYQLRVQPLTNYSVVRLQKQFDDASSSIGLLGTFTNRSFPNNYLRNQFNKSSRVIGIDGYTFLDPGRAWVVSGWLAQSNITGSKQDILNVQTSSRHYFQRPDARSYGVDSSATSMTGLAGHVVLNKQRGNFFVNTSLGFISPSFEPNDLGYLGYTNLINGHLGAGYKWTIPTNWYRQINLSGAYYVSYDFDGNQTNQGIYHSGHFQFLDYDGFNWHVYLSPVQTVNNRFTRGGPLAKNTPGYSCGISFYTNSGKEFSFDTGFGYFNYRGNSLGWNYFLHANWNPISNISLSLGPHYNQRHNFAQYVGTYADPYAIQTYGEQYIFANMDQKTVSADVRVNWTFTPALSLQLFAQPLISAGNYTNFMALARPDSYSFILYGQDGSTFNKNTYVVDPDGNGPAPPIQLDNPNFNYKSLRGNAVLRWEYRPGSTIFFVWTQSRSQSQTLGELDLNSSFNTLLNTKPNNIFLIKLSYWFNV